MEPYDWNVVLIGSWNRAILTPKGIAQRIFEIPEGSGINVFVDIDGLQPSIVQHENYKVIVEKKRLTISGDELNFEHFEKMRKYGIKALKSLPETPVQSAGYNIRYKLKQEECGITEEQIQQPIKSLIDQGCKIVSSNLHQVMEFEDGRINFFINYSDEKENVKIEFNFHKDSKNSENLIPWLELPIEKIEKEVRKIMQSIMVNYNEK